MWVSHLSPFRYAALPDSHRYKLRLGTYLWHGDREALHLEADVLDVRPVRAGSTAGYRQHAVARRRPPRHDRRRARPPASRRSPAT